MLLNAAGFVSLAFAEGSLFPLLLFAPAAVLSGFAAIVSWRRMRAAERRLAELDEQVEGIGNG